jgi:hypothetical protein
VLACGFTLRMAWEEIADPTTPAFAQTDQYDCESFGSQQSAQAELERDLSDPNDLDPDADGIACEEYDYGGEEGAAALRRGLAAELPPRRTISTTKTSDPALCLSLADQSTDPSAAARRTVPLRVPGRAGRRLLPVITARYPNGGPYDCRGCITFPFGEEDGGLSDAPDFLRWHYVHQWISGND